MYPRILLSKCEKSQILREMSVHMVLARISYFFNLLPKALCSAGVALFGVSAAIFSNDIEAIRSPNCSAKIVILTAAKFRSHNLFIS